MSHCKRQQETGLNRVQLMTEVFRVCLSPLELIQYKDMILERIELL